MTDIVQNLSLLPRRLEGHNSYKFKMTHTAMILLNDHPTYKPPLLLLITCATLTTERGTHVAKRGVFLSIAMIFDFI